jgi:hypothetical protein
LDVIDYLQERIACSRNAWADVAFASRTPNVDGSTERRTLSAAKY